MSNNKVYELRIIKYLNNDTLYILQSYEMCKRNWCISIVQDIVRTKNKYELKIKLTLLGLSFYTLVVPNIDFNEQENPDIKTVKTFNLKSSYEN